MIELAIIGNVGRDPELRYLLDGTAVCNFSVADTQKRGEKEETIWVEIAAWREEAERSSQYIRKGNKVYVRGYPSVEMYVSMP